MAIERASKVGVSGRISPENHEWLKAAAARQERSANWLLDKVLTDARLAEKTNQEPRDVAPH